MKIKLLSLISLLTGATVFSQTQVYFKYDEAGNQRYWGIDINAKNASEDLKKTALQTLKTNSIIDEKVFWNSIRFYPVPVNNFLTIDWKEEVNDLIESVSIYQHNTTHWKFQKRNIPELNLQIKINMSSYDWGVYILRFTLKDGRIFSKNILKDR